MGFCEFVELHTLWRDDGCSLQCLWEIKAIVIGYGRLCLGANHGCGTLTVCDDDRAHPYEEPAYEVYKLEDF